MTQKKAKLTIEDKTYDLPIVVGTENEKAIDISKIRSESGYVTLDPSFVSTASCYSNITFIDGEKSILRHRGYPIEEIVEHKSFIDTCYLLYHGEFPNKEEKELVSYLLTKYSLVDEDMIHFFQAFPRTSHPMHILSTMVNALAVFYPNVDSLSMQEDIIVTSTRLISVFRTLVAFAYKKSIGEKFVYPRHDLKFCENFLNMMFDSPVKPYVIDPDVVRILNMLLILHADHEQNCSTTAVRVIGSAQVNLYATISAGVSALSGPLHGGANQAVMQMLAKMHADGGDVDKYINMVKDKKSNFKLMGFGHRVYKNYDPRALIIKDACHNLLNKLGVDHPLLELAMKLEEKALTDDYFTSRKLYPNVDFYSGLIYKAIGIPEDMFTVMFALARIPGWIAQWKEMVETENGKITRPRQIYVGPKLRHIN
jgi:citrate synthase